MAKNRTITSGDGSGATIHVAPHGLVVVLDTELGETVPLDRSELSPSDQNVLRLMTKRIHTLAMAKHGKYAG